MDRRSVLRGGVGLATLAGAASWLSPLRAGQFALPEGAREAPLEALPGKVPLLRRTYRPPNYETPLSYFGAELTPNDAFFVRYHLAGIPEPIDVAAWQLEVAGPGAAKSVAFSFADLKALEKVEIIAVNQCAGNRRGFSEPHVPGVQWGPGAMGNARWGGVRLRDLLEKAAIADRTIEVSFDGADGPVLEQTPDFRKSIPLWKAVDENTLVAYEMNGEPLPHLNGAPARLVVPGWTGTYWVKHLARIEALTEPFRTFWMDPAYRVPSALFPLVERFVSQEAPNSPNAPTTEIVINSLVTNLEEGATVPAGRPVEVKGIAWDAGHGISEVAISIDDGASWRPAVLGRELGRFSWRQWSHTFTPSSRGALTIRVRARNAAGQTQVDALLFNGAGYNNNVVQALTLDVV